MVTQRLAAHWRGRPEAFHLCAGAYFVESRPPLSQSVAARKRGNQSRTLVREYDTDLRCQRHPTWTGMIHARTHRVANLRHAHLSYWYPHTRIGSQALHAWHAWLRRESVHGCSHHAIRHLLRTTGTLLWRIRHRRHGGSLVHGRHGRSSETFAFRRRGFCLR
jgi:hypothetical protein